MTKKPNTLCGKFEENGAAYAIDRPDTPQSWDNFLYSRDGELQATVSQRGAGQVQFHHAANLVSNGRNYCVVLQDENLCWSLNGGASPDQAESYRCIHRPGSTTFQASHQEIESTLKIVLDPDRYLEVNRLTLRNVSEQEVSLSVIGYHEVELRGTHKTDQMEETRYVKEAGAILFQRRHAAMPRYKYAAFYVSNRPPDSYCGSQEDFIGADAPIHQATVWQSGVLPNVDAYANQPLLALQHDLTLAAGEEITIDYGMGIADDFSETEILATDFLKQGQAEEAIKSSGLFFERFNETPITTPDAALNKHLNIWTKIQLHRQILSARFGSLHNWRNNIQDAWGWMIFDSAWARKRLLELCSVAQADGFMPRTTPKLPELSCKTQRHTDIATWAAVCAARYAAETGDLDFFRQQVSYADGTKQSTVAECLVNGLNWLLNQTGKHGMVLLLEGDWSDPLEAAGKRGIGESPWTTAALVNAMKEFIPLLDRLDRSDIASEFRDSVKQLTQAVNDHAWDGEWYIRGITDDGIRFCTSDDPDGNVSLLMQSWAIISGIIPPDRLQAVVRSVEKHNKYDTGPVLYGPPFLTERPELGRESAKRPGTGENGSCYTHAALMWAAAEIKLGRGDEALEVIKQVLPARDPDATETTGAIPLWWPNYWQGPHAKFPGRSSGRISSGAPAWFFLNICDGLLGVRPTLDGLVINPCFPSNWPTASFQRRWRGSLYDIEYIRDPQREGIIVEMDGEIMPNQTIPVPTRPGTHEVIVSL